MAEQNVVSRGNKFVGGLFERLADGILMFAEGSIVDGNRAAYTTLGYSASEVLLGRKLADFSPAYQPDGETSADKETKVMASLSTENNIRTDWIYRRANGETFPVELLLTRLSEADPFEVCVLWRDISKRKQIEAELQQAQRTLEKRVEDRTKQIEREQQVAEGLRELLNILNSNRTIEEILTYIVHQTAHLLGNNAGAVYLIQGTFLQVKASFGLNPDLLVGIGSQTQGSPTRLAVSEKRPVIVSNGDINLLKTNTVIHLDSLPEQLNARYQALLAVPLIVKEQTYGTITLYYYEPKVFSEADINLAMAFGNQAALAIENAYLRLEAEKDAAVAERNRIARDLHDSVTQTLFSAALIAQVLPRLWDRDRGEGYRQLEELRLLTRGALAEMRTLLLELRPSAFVKAPLSESIRHLVDAAIGRTGIPIKLTIQGDTPIPPDIKAVFYRIGQEALNNIIKHADASQAELILVRQPGVAELYVQDNGVGFIRERVPQTHLGLAIMSERAQSIGATLMIESQPGQGTSLSLRWKNTGT